MADWQLAQFNIARLVAPFGDSRVQEFFDALDAVNSLAEASPGFVWRLKDEAGNATDIQATVDPRMIINMSVWQDADTLFEFVYKSAHTPVMARRREWFDRSASSYQVLWWVAHGHEPSVDEGFARLWHLDHFGPTPHAFTFKARFPRPDMAGAPVDMEPDPWCLGNA